MLAADLLYKAKGGFTRSTSSLLSTPPHHTDLYLIHTKSFARFTPERKLFTPAHKYTLSVTMGTPEPSPQMAKAPQALPDSLSQSSAVREDSATLDLPTLTCKALSSKHLFEKSTVADRVSSNTRFHIPSILYCPFSAAQTDISIVLLEKHSESAERATGVFRVEVRQWDTADSASRSAATQYIIAYIFSA